MKQYFKKHLGIYYFTLIYTIALSIFMSGCATQNKSTALGGAIGAGTGAVLGGIADPGKDGEFRTRNVVVGAALGGIAGMIAGETIHKNTEKQKKEAFNKGRASQRPQGQMPNLSNPKVEATWMEGRTVGHRYVEGHWEYTIVEPARWEEQ